MLVSTLVHPHPSTPHPTPHTHAPKQPYGVAVSNNLSAKPCNIAAFIILVPRCAHYFWFACHNRRCFVVCARRLFHGSRKFFAPSRRDCYAVGPAGLVDARVPVVSRTGTVCSGRWWQHIPVPRMYGFIYATMRQPQPAVAISPSVGENRHACDSCQGKRGVRCRQGGGGITFSIAFESTG